MNESSTMSFDVTRRSVSDETFREFYCSAQRVPDNILRKTLNQMGGRWEFLDTKDVADALYNEGLLTYNEFYKLTNVYVDQRDRTSDLLYKILPAKGNEQNTLVTFYHCLLRCHINRDLLTELRAHALKMCGVDRPVLVPGITASDEILQQMLGKLTACVPSEQAKNFAKSLDLNGNDLPDSPHIQLSDLCKVWIVKKHHECTPEALVEALVCTEGLGKYASGIGAPTNPPDVESYFYHLQNKWWNMAAFLGYSKEDLDAVITEPDNSVQRQIAKFLAIFKMPDCGACTITILHKAGGKAGITSQSKREHFGFQWNSFAGMKGMTCGVSMPMLETFEDEPKPKAATASPPQMKPHGAAPPSHLWPWNIPQPPWAAAMQLASVFPPPPWCGVHCHSPFQGQMPSYGYPPAPEFLQTLVAQVQSLSEWRQAQCRDGESEGCGDPCEQAIITSKQAEEVHGSATINTIPDAEHPSSANAAQNVPGSATASIAAVTRENEISGSRLDGNKDLLMYCRKGDPDDIEIVAALLDSGASLKVQTEDDGSYPLHVAVLSKSYQMLSLLVPYYDSLDMIDVVRHDHKTALMLACKEKNYEFVRLLVEHTADVNTKDCDGFSCLHLKETLESPDIVQLLIDKGADVDNPTDGNNLTPLTHACVLGLSQSIEILLSSGARPDGLPGAASTPLCAAAEADHSHVVQTLLERKANINLQDQDGFTPLLKACKAGHVGIASKLINANADKDRADKAGNTPVLVAVDTNNTELLQLLVACGANVNQFKVVFSGDTEFEVTPLILAAGRGKLDIVEILVENKANVNYSSRYTVSALTYAVRGGHAHVVEYLLKVNDMIRTVDVLYAPLLVAVRSEENYILKLLLDALGGYEKALRDATDTGAQDLVEALSQLDEMGRPKRPEMVDRSSVTYSATLQHLNPRHLHECMDRILVTKAAVKTAERKLGWASLVDEARKSGHEHIVCFFEQFFSSSDVGPEMFFEFINMTPCPSPAIFTFENKMAFDGGTFKNILDEMNIDAIEYLPLALMQIPGLEDTCLDGEGLMQLLFGKRFFETVQCLNLLEAAKPSLKHGATRLTQDQTREYLQYDHSEDSNHDSRLSTHRSRADKYELQDIESDHDSYLSTHRDGEDKHELQDVESPVETSVESHSQSKEPAVEQQDQLSEESELDHQVQPVLRTDSGQTREERTDKSKVSRATSLPTATKARIRPTNPVRKSRIPRRVGLKHCNPHVSMPSRSVSKGDEPDSHTSIRAHELAQQCRMPKSTRRQSQVYFKVHRDKDMSKVSPNAEPATIGTARSRNSEQRGSASIPVRRVCGMYIQDTPITNSEMLRVFSRRVVDWKSLAKYLNVDEREINRINHDYKLEEERCCQMLHLWCRTQSNHATYARLAKGFKEIGQEYLIKDLQKHLKDTAFHEASMMDREIEIDLSRETWGAEIVRLTLWLDEKRTEGFTAARIQIKLEQ